jgi:hypothetical protein
MSLKNHPLPSAGGDEGEGGLTGLCFVHPHPHPPPCPRRSDFAQAGIEGGGDYLGNFKYLWLEFTWSFEFGYWNLARIDVVLSNRFR